MDTKIKIYTTPSCVYCKMAKDLFKKNGWEYEEIDVSRDITKIEEMEEKSGQRGVPVIEIGDKIIIGFDKKRIEEAMNELKQTAASI